MLLFARAFSHRISRFCTEEDGAATVDWVVGTAVAVTMGLAVMNQVSAGATALADKISDSLANFEMCWGPDCGTEE